MRSNLDLSFSTETIYSKNVPACAGTADRYLADIEPSLPCFLTTKADFLILNLSIDTPFFAPIVRDTPPVFFMGHLRFFIILFFVFCCPLSSFAEGKAASALKAQRAYEEKKYDDALERYNDLNQKYPDDAKVQYNLANSYYEKGKYPEAANHFLGASLKNEDPALNQQALFNLGNSYYRQGKLEEAVAAYQKVLELDPNDLAAKQNLEFVQKEIKKRMDQEKERQEKQKSNEDKSEDQKEKEKDAQQKENREPEGKEKAPQGSPEEQNKDASQEAGAEGDKEKGDEGREARPGDPLQQISPEEAERYLNALKEDGAKVLKKQMQGEPKTGVRRERDW